MTIPVLCARWPGMLLALLLLCAVHASVHPADTAPPFVLDSFPPAPPAVVPAQAFFTVAGEYPSYEKATLGLANLRRRAPDIRFQLFPPYGEWRSWTVMAAAWVSSKDARFASDVVNDRHLASSYVRSLADMAGRPVQWGPEAESVRGKIISCLGQGVSTIAGMYGCAGAIVTPDSLARCVTGGLCTLDLNILNLPDYLAAHRLNMDSPLIVSASGALSPQLIKTCLKRSADSVMAINCLVLGQHGGPADPACLGKSGEAAVTCMVEQKLDAKAKAAFECIRKAAGAQQVALCAGTSDVATTARLKACLSGKTDLASAMANCAPVSATAEQKAVIACIANLGAGKARPQDCLRSRAEWTRPVQMGQCLRGAKAEVKTILDCARSGGLDVPPDIAACVTAFTAGRPEQCAAAASNDPVVRCVSGHRGNPDDLWVCLAQSDATARSAVEAYRCLSSGNGTAELLATCATSFLPPETRQAATCLSKAGRNAKASAVCVISPGMGKEEARLLNCAASAQGYASFGVCALAPQMNQEWRIAAECAAAGGAPPVMAGCVAGRLTIAELEKCFSKGVGGDGCFGENNTLVVGIRNVANDITHGPGPNNDIVKGINALGNSLRLF